jgi:apolipoprotein D and lipocalin family protein
MDDAVYKRLLDEARQQGYPVEQVRRVPQQPADVGKPGYQ